MPGIKSVVFGPGASPYDLGQRPSCAVTGKTVIAVHETEDGAMARVADLDGVQLTWHAKPTSVFETKLTTPAVAINKDKVAVVVGNQNGKLAYTVGTVRSQYELARGTTVISQSASGGESPSVAVTENGILIELHQVSSSIQWRRGQLTGETVTWQQGQTQLTDGGIRPSVAVNDDGVAIAVWDLAGNLYYSVGTFDKNDTSIAAAITWSTPVPYDTGLIASVALTNGNDVFLLHQKGQDANGSLYQRVGTVQGTTIHFHDVLSVGNKAARVYDSGIQARIATDGKVAIEVHAEAESEDADLFATASLAFDRANWMGNNRGDLADKTLRQIAFPGSHDTGAFADDRAQTQDLTVASQLAYGARYFDLRPYYKGNKTTVNANGFTTYHDIPAGDFFGPNFTEVIGDIRNFMLTHQELVILKLSHYKAVDNQPILDNKFNQAIFDALVGLFTAETNGLKTWLFLPPAATAGRIANMKMSEFLTETRGTVLLLADLDDRNDDTDYVTDTHHSNGVLRYRDWYAADPGKGDVTVFDLFSSTADFAKMAQSTSNDLNHSAIPGSRKKVPRGQLPKFLWFDGLCQGTGTTRSTVQCDLFVLSWTLTPTTPLFQGRAFDISTDANKNLVEYLSMQQYSGRNPNQQTMNVLYTDAMEFSRSVDIALARNGLAK
jgi:hypothetical protein